MKLVEGGTTGTREPTASLSEGGNGEQPGGCGNDLCSMHKGLAEFLIFEEGLFQGCEMTETSEQSVRNESS